MQLRRIALASVLAPALAAGLVGCSSTARHTAGEVTSTTVTPVVTTPATQPPVVTSAPPTVAPVTEPPATTPAHSLYDEVAPPTLPSGHTDAVGAAGVLADGVYWVQYNGGEKFTPDITVLQAFFGAECESAATAAGEECLDGIFTPSDPSREIADLPFHADVHLTVADSSTQRSYWITPDELVTIRASSPSDGAPAGFGFTPFPFLMTVVGGEITRFEQFWTP